MYEKAIKKIKDDQKCKSNFYCCSIIGPTGPAGGPTGPMGPTGATD